MNTRINGLDIIASPIRSEFRRTTPGFGCATTVAVAILAFGLPADRAHAADAQPVDDGALQEIVVTASKRESNLQSTAISITALTGESLQEHGITALADVIHATPGVSFRSNGGPGQTEIQIRGMTSTGGEAPTVGFYLDEVPLTPAAQSNNGKAVIDPNLFDLNRVEVLRGPQGTLYGAGSMGGTIRMITNQPDLQKFSVNAQAILSNTHSGGFNRTENGAINLPIIDGKVALRVVYSDTRNSGWIDRVVLNPFPLPTNPDPACGPVYGCVRGNVLAAPVQARYRDVNDLQSTGARASLLIQATDRLSIVPMVVYQHASAGGLSLFDTVPGTLAHYQPLDVNEPVSDNFVLYSGTIKYHLDAFDITSVSSKWNRESKIYQDFAEQMQEVFFTPGYSLESGGLGSGQIYDFDTVSQFSQELRLTTNGEGPVKGIIGAFYSDFDSRLLVNGSLPGAEALAGQSVIAFQDQPTKIKQYALFGEVSYKFNDQFEATVGLRRYKYQSQLGVTSYGAATGADVNAPITSFNKTSDVGNNPKLSLAYTPNDRELLYFTAAKGFRPGSGNGPVPLTGPTSCVDSLAALGRTSPPGSFKADSLWSYELGNKLQMLDRRVVLNTAVYFERWSDIQQQIALPCGWLFTDNQGTANIYGGELELAARLSSSFTVKLNAAYTHAALTADVPAAGGKKGQQLQNIPKVTGGASIEYSRQLGANYRFLSRLSDDYTGNRVDAFGPLPGYNLIDFRIGVSGDAWTAHLFAKNLTNRVVNISNPVPMSINTPLYIRAVSNQPAVIGVDVTYRY